MEIIINSEQSLRAAQRQLEIQFQQRSYVKAKLTYGQQRTLTQNAALHKFCQMLADQLNDAGLDQLKVLKPGAEIPWTMNAVKENLWRPIQEVVLGKESTAKAHREEYSKVYDVLNRHMINKFGITAPWPSKDN